MTLYHFTSLLIAYPQMHYLFKRPKQGQRGHTNLPLPRISANS